ncbi:RNA-guided endonuclease InsQ/TnpB family protein [Vibrio crassostreae]|uniref:RNA-guided endonuclease InsQ/TnpB family protein n=1 Tax=Vibrio crassostreae TaxID=246167 RepID=UPI000633A2E0|nr:RNA-guided endonuclease TnpB family protein [Vibrio crassostreae]CAH6913051.1 transposase [Vibrio chagasii]TCO05796.1 putative transposase [Vibrio crassostreae]CAH6918354.1 transposase [Vibrio chagasii]CAH7132296.1 transposase [Vibrio chagasii]CAK2388723.1 putative RNA-guided DNA endonuclease [Vibrio crassostreae]
MKERAYKYRIYPTPEQVTLLEQTFGCTRFVYNSILRWRTDAYHNEQIKINYNNASSYLTELKKNAEFPWLNDVSCVPLQQSLRHQQTAFKNFFEGRAKYPTFKKKRSKQSAEFTKSAFKYRDGQLFIAKSKLPLNVRWSRELPSEPTTITISKDSAGRYFVSCLCRFEAKSLPISKNTVGIDLGLTDLVITSNGFKSGNPRHIKRYASKLAKAQCVLSKKKKGSSNFHKARKKVARVQAKIADCRRDFTHKLTSQLINDNQVISCESLSVKNMVKNRKLAKAISDANWGEFVNQLKYKAEWYGRTVVQIDKWYPSSKRCNCCGHVVDSLPLYIRKWSCPECSSELDRDLNAALNIKAVGQTVLACGA